jgi:anti-sigma factor RsiW
MKWFWNRCRRRQDASLLAAGALGEDEKIVAERHLGACDECRSYYNEIKALTAPLAAWDKGFSAVEVSPSARLRWAGAVQRSGAPATPRRPSLLRTWEIIWRELVWPSRYAWGGMAALWVAMLVINGELAGPRVSGMSARVSSPREMLQAWREQNRVLAELVPPAQVVPVPAPDVLRPRTQREQDWAII